MGAQHCDAAALKATGVYWSYCPNQPAAILFAALYGISGCIHAAQMIIYRRRNASIITMGALLETVAFILRLIVIQTLNLGQIYEAQFVIILVAPMFMNAFDFVLLSELVNYCLVDKKLCKIPARRIGIYFVGLDVLTFLVQLAGAAITTSTNNSTIVAGLHIYTAGVALQQFFILCFIVLAYHFRRRMLRECDEEKVKRLRVLLYTLYTTLGLISFRVIFRIIEFSGNNESKLSKMITDHEIFLYMFDSLPMFIVLVLFNLVHPSRILIGPDAQWPKLSKEEKRARKDLKKREKVEKRLAKTGEMPSIELAPIVVGSSDTFSASK